MVQPEEDHARRDETWLRDSLRTAYGSAEPEEQLRRRVLLLSTGPSTSQARGSRQRIWPRALLAAGAVASIVAAAMLAPWADRAERSTGTSGAINSTGLGQAATPSRQLVQSSAWSVPLPIQWTAINSCPVHPKDLDGALVATPTQEEQYGLPTFVITNTTDLPWTIVPWLAPGSRNPDGTNDIGGLSQPQMMRPTDLIVLEPGGSTTIAMLGRPATRCNGSPITNQDVDYDVTIGATQGTTTDRTTLTPYWIAGLRVTM